MFPCFQVFNFQYLSVNTFTVSFDCQDAGGIGTFMWFLKLGHFPSIGTGLKIPPAAQQALQMTGSMPFGNMPGPAGDFSFLKKLLIYIYYL